MKYIINIFVKVERI